MIYKNINHDEKNNVAITIYYVIDHNNVKII